MPPLKNSTLILRIPLKLKQKIEDLAKENNISASEFVRKLIEDSIYKDEQEIKEHIQFVNSLSKHIDELLKKSSRELDSGNAEEYTKEIHEYKKLLYMHQSKVIKLLSEKLNIDNADLITFNNDKKFIHLKRELMKNITEYNKPYEEFFKDFNMNDKIESALKDEYLAELTWERADRLYSQFLKKYEGSQ